MASILNTNHINRYLMNNNGGNQSDSKGATTLTRFGTVSRVAGDIEQYAAHFVGNGANYLLDTDVSGNMTTGALAKWKGSWTIQFRFKASAAFLASGDQAIISAGNQWMANGWYFYANGINTGLTFNFDDFSSTGVSGPQTTSGVWKLGYNHIIIRHDATARRVSAFINGRRYVGAQYGVGKVIMTPTTNTCIGILPRGDDPPNFGTLPSDCDFSVINIWNKACSDREALAMYKARQGLAVADWDSPYPAGFNDSAFIPGVDYTARSTVGNMPSKVFAEGDVAVPTGVAAACYRMRFTCQVPGINLVHELSNGVYIFGTGGNPTGEDGYSVVAGYQGPIPIPIDGASMLLPQETATRASLYGGVANPTLAYGDVIESDPITDAVLFEGDNFWVTVMAHPGLNLHLPAHHQMVAANGEGWTANATNRLADINATNFTQGADAYGFAPTNAYFNAATVGDGDHATSGFFISDSIGEDGKHPKIATDQTGALMVNIGSAGDSVINFFRPGGGTCRLKIAKKGMCVGIQDGTNDIQADTTLASKQTNLYNAVVLLAAGGVLKKLMLWCPTPYSTNPGNASEARTVDRNNLITWLLNAALGAQFSAGTGIACLVYQGAVLAAQVAGRGAGTGVLDIAIISEGNKTVEITYLLVSGRWTDVSHVGENGGGTPHLIHPDSTYQTQIATDELPQLQAFSSQAAPIPLPVVSLHPASQSVTSGQSVSFTSAADTGTLQWQRNNGSGWNAIGGATSSPLALGVVSTADNGAQFRAAWTNASGTVYSNVATLLVASLIGGQTTTNFIAAVAAAGAAVIPDAQMRAMLAAGGYYTVQESADHLAIYADANHRQLIGRARVTQQTDGTYILRTWSAASPVYGL